MITGKIDRSVDETTAIELDDCPAPFAVSTDPDTGKVCLLVLGKFPLQVRIFATHEQIRMLQARLTTFTMGRWQHATPT
jgi:hypothetical protein